MMKLSCDVIERLRGRTLVTAESCTGGGIGAALTAVAGSSEVYKGGIISYTNGVKQTLLGVPESVLREFGAVSEQVAALMASGIRERMSADIAVSVTGLAGPGGDDFGNPVGTVYIGLCNGTQTQVRKHLFSGDREAVRQKAVTAALEMILQQL